MIFNILDCFDENIDNLDITKNYIYVLKLVEERYYVGRTTNILRRIKQHFSGYGAKYTKKYKPLKVVEVIKELTIEDERLITFKYVEKYGWEKVRGSYWCSVKMKKAIDPKIYNFIKNENLEKEKYDEEIKKMYTLENKNIIEIGEKFDRTPGSIAHRLVKLGLINHYKQSRGYDDYKNSNTYIENCNKNKNKKSYRPEYYFNEEADQKIIEEYQNEENDIFSISINNTIKIYQVISVLIKHKIIKRRSHSRGYDKYIESEEYKSKLK